VTKATRRAALVGSALFVAALLTACGIPNMSAPVAITPVATATRTASPASPDLTGPGGSELFLVGSDGKLVPVRRAPTSGDAKAQVEQALSQLTAGPDGDEQARGLTSAIPPGLSVMLSRMVGPQAVVDIRGSDPGPATEEAKLATAQVVLTLTSIPAVDSVLLTRNGQPQAVLPDGELTDRPMTRADVAALLQQ
jgi:spore germination protein GerM